MPLTSLEINTIRKSVTEDFSLKWEDNKKKPFKTGQESDTYQDNSKDLISHSTTRTSNKEALEQKNPNKTDNKKLKLNKRNKKNKKYKLQRPKLSQNRSSHKSKKSFISRKKRKKESTFLNQNLSPKNLKTKSPTIKQSMKLQKRNLKAQLYIIMPLKLLRDKRNNKSIRNKKLKRKLRILKSNNLPKSLYQLHKRRKKMKDGSLSVAKTQKRNDQPKI